MIDAMIARCSLTYEAEIKDQLQLLYEGLVKNGTAAEPGFIARSVCVSNGKSVYMDSSKDQYTNWTYAAHRLLNSDLIDQKQKEVLKEILVNIAKKLERDLNSEYKGYLLRLDGKPGIVSDMDSENLGAHEILRMQMLYMAAYEASGDECWYQKYCERREDLLARTESAYTLQMITAVARGGWGKNYIYYQAQCSMRLIYDVEKDEEYRKRYLRLLEISAMGTEEFVKKAYDNRRVLQDEQEYFTPWRKASANYSGLFYGKSYYIPNLYEGKPVFKWSRNMAESIVIQSICPGYEIPEWGKDMFFSYIEEADFAGAKCYWPVLFCCAWWLAKFSGNIA